jgi:single-strand DNA-binding protein
MPINAAGVDKNEVHLAGCIVRDPVIKYTATGKAVANLTLVTKYEKYSEFHRIVAWEKLAEKAEKITKGDFVRVVGRLQSRSWDDKTSGQKKYITEVVAFQLSIPSEEPAPLTPDATKSGTDIARAILRPAKEASDGDPAF